MIRVGVVCHGKAIEFNAEDTKAIAEAAAALGVSFEVLQEQIIRFSTTKQFTGLTNSKTLWRKQS